MQGVLGGNWQRRRV